MATFKSRPLSPAEAPDTARVYERAKPEAESGMGRLEGEKGTPTRGRDKMLEASSNKHRSRQLNSEDAINVAGGPVKVSNAPARKTRRDLATEKNAVRQRTQRKG
jgi:hypothetical protein